MKNLKTLTLFFLAVASFVLVGCSQSQEKVASTQPKEVAEQLPKSDPSKVVQCYDTQGNATPEAAAWAIDSVKIVYEHRPSEIVLVLHNMSANVLGNVSGVIELYGENGQKYDSVDFSKSCKFAAGESGAVSIYLGDKRVHPNQEWNRDVKLFFTKTAPDRFTFIGSDNDWCECIAKVVDVHINSFEVFE